MFFSLPTRVKGILKREAKNTPQVPISPQVPHTPQVPISPQVPHTPQVPISPQVPHTPIKTLDDVSKWKIKPHLHPINNVPIEISISPNDFYVKLYKEAIAILVKELGNKDGGVLSIEDCKFIRKHLPDAHIHVVDEFDYDHLFIKYFIKKDKKYSYDKNYIAYGTDIFLYFELYKIIKRKRVLKSLPPPTQSQKLKNIQFQQPSILPALSPTRLSQLKQMPKNLPASLPIRLYQLKQMPKKLPASSSSSSQFQKQNIPKLKDFLTGNISDPSSESEISINNIMIRLCKDILYILHINLVELTKENYSNLIKNFKVLKYVYNIYNIAGDELKLKCSEKLSTISSDDGKILMINKWFLEKIGYIEGSIFEFSKLFSILINIYDKIILLYDYYFPYYLNEVIYEKHCFGKYDPINMEIFDDTKEINNGEITIIPKYNEDKIISYDCFLTEELYKSLLNNIACYGIQNNNKPLNHPIHRIRFTRNDVNHIVNQLLIKLKKDMDSVDKEAVTKSISFLQEIFDQVHLKVTEELEYLEQIIIDNNYVLNDSLSQFEKDTITTLNKAISYLTVLKSDLEELRRYLNESNPSLKIVLEKPEFKNFINKTLKATIQAITKEEEQLDLHLCTFKTPILGQVIF